MTIRNIISEIVAEWPKYKESRKVDKNARAYDLVVNAFPSSLQSIAQNTDYLKFHGSTGQGNITAAPWVATFDTRITSSATSGFYVVYLFSIDLKCIFLKFGFGTTQFTNHFKKKSECYKKIRTAAGELQERHEKKLLPLFKQALHDNISREPIDLAATSRDGLHEAYEQSAIYSIEYPLSELPSEEHLESDFNSFLTLYREIALDPLALKMEELFEWAAEPANTTGESAITNFKPRPAKKRRKESSSKSSQTRRSKESLKVGNAGEITVLNYEKEKLKKAGRSDLAGKVIHESAEGNTPGWGITSFNEEGEKIFIEVKSSTGKVITSIDITSNEWKAASDHKDKYFLYLVTNALTTTTPPVEILKNPWSYVDRGELEIKPIVHELSLQLKG
jgi:hypothetical protein